MTQLFDELRLPDAKMQNGKDLPALFDFTAEELSIRPDLMSKLVPQHAEAPLLERGIDVRNFTPIPAEEMRITLD
jgi:glycogen synthase kinase 3 beta